MPIPGTTKMHRLEENIGSIKTILTAADLLQINKALADINIRGARYPEQAQKMINR